MSRAFAVLLFIALVSIARGQSTSNLGDVQGTSLGQDQNDERDYVNSLVPGPEKFGKGEKKTQMSRAELKTKSINDSTFGGSLLDMGINPAEPKLDAAKLVKGRSEVEQKPVASKQQTKTTEKEPAPATKEETAAVEKQSAEAAQPRDEQQTFSNLSMTATLADALVEEDKAAAEARDLSSSGDSHNKDQAATTGDKTSTATSSDKSSDTKPNGDH